MKIEDIEEVNKLARDMRNLNRFHEWQSGFRSRPSVEIRNQDGVPFHIELTYGEIDAAIERYRCELEDRAIELGVEL